MSVNGQSGKKTFNGDGSVVAKPLKTGVELRFRLRIGLDESLQDRILTKVRKRLSRQNSTKLCVNLWENVQHKTV